jgi:hypothetical protein
LQRNSSGCWASIPNAASAASGKSFRFAVHDNIAAADNGGGENMPVIGVWKLKRWDQALIACDQGIARVAVHKIARPLQSSAVQVRLVRQQVLDSFAVNVGRSLGLVYVRDGKLQKQIAHGRGIEHVGVEQRCVIAHGRE